MAMGLGIVAGLYSLPNPTELDSTIVYSFCSEDFAFQIAEDLIRRLRNADVPLTQAEVAGVAPDWFELE